MGDYQRLDRRPEPCPGPPDCPLEEKVGKIYHDLYFGSGPEDPPFTMRILLLEKNQLDNAPLLSIVQAIRTELSPAVLMASQLIQRQ